MKAIRLVLIPVLLCACLGCAATASEAASPSGGAQSAEQPKPAAVVGMTGTLKYDPAKITVKVGDTVEWRNTSLISHTVTADPALAKDKKNVLLPDGAKPFNSGDMPRKATFRYTFTVPGLYRYFCIPHEKMGMVGEVIVIP